ncbi:Phox homologous domain-containing protein [Lipomyces japonicus]|uniref:Phox homologous domain-containing protein n=1 Tax=Lipomyces japonicus TaxID=56871 RepID=UPI0034CF54A4
MAMDVTDIGTSQERQVVNDVPVVVDKNSLETQFSKLREAFTFNRTSNHLPPLIESWKNSFSSAPILQRSDTTSSLSTASFDSDDAHSLISPVPPGIYGSPGDPHDLAQVDPIPITLVDHSMNDEGINSNMWARSAWVGDYSIVPSTGKNGSYVTWLCIIDTIEGDSVKVRKRYSEFVQLQKKLFEEFPMLRAAIPNLPPKSMISNFRPFFLEQRRRGLEYFLACVVLNPVFSGSTAVKDFIKELVPS